VAADEGAEGRGGGAQGARGAGDQGRQGRGAAEGALPTHSSSQHAHEPSHGEAEPDILRSRPQLRQHLL